MAVVATPSIGTFLKTLRTTTNTTEVESAIEHLISLLKRRQIRNSRPCAIATAHLLLRVIAVSRQQDAERLIERIRHVGQRLIAAQPREMVVGNIVRRVLGLIREIVEDEGKDTETAGMSEATTPGDNPHPPTAHDSLKRPTLSSTISTFSPLKHGATIPAEAAHFDGAEDESEPQTVPPPLQSLPTHRPPLLTSHTSYATSTPVVTSLFGLLQHPETPSPTATPPSHASPRKTSGQALTAQNLARINEAAVLQTKTDLKAEVIEGIREIIDELDQVDELIAAYALDHIHSNEIILTYTSSMTVQKFLLTAARKRKFTVIHAEAYPNDHEDVHATVLKGRKMDKDEDVDDEGPDDHRFKPLTAAGITVILIPDSAVFAIMSRVNKVILATHTVLANGGLVAAAGAKMIAKAAKMHQTPVVVVSGIYKLSPVYPFNVEELIEYGDPSKVVAFQEGDMVEGVDVLNPLFDYVPPEVIDLYLTNIGGHAPSYLYRIVADHYRVEDINL